MASNLKHQVALVTGASGLVGSHLARKLREQGNCVRVLARPTSNLAPLQNLDIEVTYGDITQSESLAAAVQGCTHVYHCAAWVADYGPRELFWTTNVDGTRNVLSASRDANVQRFVYISTTDVYGYRDRDDADEETPFLDRGWYYQSSKIAAERLVWTAAQAGVPVTVVRPASVIGERSTQLVGEPCDVLRQRLMILVNGGRCEAGLVYAGNLADAIILAGDAPHAAGRAYNAHDAYGISWREYVNDLADGLGVPHAWLRLPYGLAYGIGAVMESVWKRARPYSRPLLTRTAVALLGTSQNFCTKRLRDELGYKPAVPYTEAVARSVNWYRQWRKLET